MNARPISVALVLAGTAALPVHAAPTTNGRVTAVEFSSTPAPINDAEMAGAYTRSVATVRYADGRHRDYPLDYRTLFRSGERVGAAEAGLVVDAGGKAVAVAGDNAGNVASGPFHAFAPDANSLLRVKEGKAEKLYLLTHWEYHTEAAAIGGKGSVDLYGQLPMAMSLATVAQNRAKGTLRATALRNVDFASKDGLWIPCAGAVTPWNTHLGGEEYEPDARIFEREPLEPMNLYLGTHGKRADQGGAKPYRYGGIVEVAVKAGGRTAVHKRYAMGRLATELAEVMPDGRTAYMGDDGRDTILAMFVADRAKDLSAGTLYAARWEQTAAENGGAAELKWIRLGHANEAEIKALVDGGIHYSDIFEVASAEAVKADPARHADFKPAWVYEGHPGRAAAKPGVSWLRLKPGMEKAAAFLETRRYAALLGATTEFTKMEGVTHDAAGRRLYVAMSYIEGGMIEGLNAERPQDHIRIKGDPRDLVCGGVYQSQLAGGIADTGGEPIRSDWVATDMQAMLLGAKKPAGQAHGPYDKCDTDRIANPDNIKYSREMRTLFVGEDSGNHLNNFLWAYQVDGGKLARLLVAPAGGEHTGLQVVPNLNGHAYIMGNIQHPGAAADLKSYPDAVKVELRKQIDQRGTVGYLGGLPALK